MYENTAPLDNFFQEGIQTSLVYGQTASNNCYQPFPWQYQHPYYVYTKVNLSLEEINKLKKLAEKDPELKNILNKMKYCIDINIEF